MFLARATPYAGSWTTVAPLQRGDGSSPIVTVVVDDDHVSVDFGASAQARSGGLDRIQSRRDVGLFVEGRDDDRKISLMFKVCAGSYSVCATSACYGELARCRQLATIST